MSLNLLINGAFGTIPIVGNLFSISVKIHARNAQSLQGSPIEKHGRPGSIWSAHYWSITVDRHTPLECHCPIESEYRFMPIFPAPVFWLVTHQLSLMSG